MCNRLTIYKVFLTMKKINFFLSVIALLIVLSCSSDNDDDSVNSIIVGKWDYKASSATKINQMTGEVRTDFSAGGVFPEGTDLFFNDDGTYCSQWKGDTVNGHYKLSNNTIVFIVDTDTLSCLIEELNSHYLSIYNEKVHPADRNVRVVWKNTFEKKQNSVDN